MPKRKEPEPSGAAGDAGPASAAAGGAAPPKKPPRKRPPRPPVAPQDAYVGPGRADNNDDEEEEDRGLHDDEASLARERELYLRKREEDAVHMRRASVPPSVCRLLLYFVGRLSFRTCKR